MDYQNQNATVKPNEVFIWCSEQGKFRVKVNISRLAYCLTTFHKLTLTFGKWKWQNYQSEDPQAKKRTLLRDWEPFLRLRFQEVFGFKGVKLKAEREIRTKKWILVFPHHKASVPRWLTCVNIKESLLPGTKRKFLKTKREKCFSSCINLILEVFISDISLSPKTTMTCSAC